MHCHVPALQVEIAMPVVERGPAPERSPLRVRFDAPGGGASLSVIVRSAQALKPSLLQVSAPERRANVQLRMRMRLRCPTPCKRAPCPGE